MKLSCKVKSKAFGSLSTDTTYGTLVGERKHLNVPKTLNVRSEKNVRVIFALRNNAPRVLNVAQAFVTMVFAMDVTQTQTVQRETLIATDGLWCVEFNLVAPGIQLQIIWWERTSTELLVLALMTVPSRFHFRMKSSQNLNSPQEMMLSG
jgi:hypothetical protein